MRCSTLLLSLLLLTLALARLPSAKLAFDPSQQISKFIDQALKSRLQQSPYVIMDKYQLYVSQGNHQAESVSVNSTNHTLSINYGEKYVMVYIYTAEGSYKDYAYVYIDHVLLSYDNDGVFGLHVEELTYKTKDTMKPEVKAALDEMKGAINDYLKKVNNCSLLKQNFAAYWPQYDMHLNMTSNMTVGKHLIDMELDTQLCHSYDSLSACSLPEEETFAPSSKNNSLQISSGLFNGYLASGYKNGAFKITMNSKAIANWKNWLNLDIADLDMGLLKAMVPEMDNDMEDNTLLDLELSAYEVPTVSFKENSAHMTVRLSAAFLVQKNVVGKLKMDGRLSSKVTFNPATHSLDMSNLEVDFSALSLLDDEDKIIQSGEAYALSALAQLAQPALTQMINMKGLNMNKFMPTLKYFTPSIQDVVIEKGQMTVLLDMDVKTFSWKTLNDSIMDNQL